MVTRGVIGLKAGSDVMFERHNFVGSYLGEDRTRAQTDVIATTIIFYYYRLIHYVTSERISRPRLPVRPNRHFEAAAIPKVCSAGNLKGSAARSRGFRQTCVNVEKIVLNYIWIKKSSPK